jgi:hypothetical protein
VSQTLVSGARVVEVRSADAGPRAPSSRFRWPFDAYPPFVTFQDELWLATVRLTMPDGSERDVEPRAYVRTLGSPANTFLTFRHALARPDPAERGALARELALAVAARSRHEPVAVGLYTERWRTAGRTPVLLGSTLEYRFPPPAR